MIKDLKAQFLTGQLGELGPVILLRISDGTDGSSDNGSARISITLSSLTGLSKQTTQVLYPPFSTKGKNHTSTKIIDQAFHRGNRESFEIIGFGFMT